MNRWAAVEERFLSAQADRFAGAKLVKKVPFRALIPAVTGADGFLSSGARGDLEEEFWGDVEAAAEAGEN